MSLNWNIAKCANHEALTATPAAAQTTQAIVFETLAVGIGKITEQNVGEFKIRSDFFRRLNGFHAELIPLDELRKRIGLYTNVSTETWAKFVKRHADGFKRDAEYDMRRAEIVPVPAKR